jgi:hypothetical protein
MAILEESAGKKVNPLLYAAIAASLAAAYGVYKVAGLVKDLPTKTASAAFPALPEKSSLDAPTSPLKPPAAPSATTAGDTAANVASALSKVIGAAGPTLKTIVDRASSGPKEESNIVNDVAKDWVAIDWGNVDP